MKILFKGMRASFAGFFILSSFFATAQTDMDAIMMEKNAFCVGPMYSYSSWKDYWEGTLKRENLNIGKVTTQMYSVMGNYGINRKLNALFSAPYVKNKSIGRYASWHGWHTRPEFVFKMAALSKKIR